MRIVSTLLFSITLLISAQAQISHGGEPASWNASNAADMEFYTLSPPDIKALEREDETLDQHPDIPFRYGAIAEVDLDTDQNGNWTSLSNGDRIWRLAIESEGALSLNFLFDVYQIPEGGEVFVYNPERTQLLGSFTHENTSKINSLGVGIVHGDKMIIEYVEPAEVSGEGYLHIDKITHGYRPILGAVAREKAGPFGNSGACNIDVNCPEGIPFDFQKRSVALIVVNNNSLCSGALVNNTLQDQTPYFLTANHCLPGNPSNTQNWVFYFNHETPECNGNDDDAPTNQTVSGASLRASNAESDFGLLEFNNSVPDSYNVCYSGWDASDNQDSGSSFGIHHPSGDVKKICFDEDAPYHQNLGIFVNQVWYIDQWEDGVTEGGSSGSPLFNDAGLLIGQLAGGLAACSGTVNNGQFDYYGRLGVSWDFGSSSTTRLSDWLDEANTGQMIVPNSCAASAPDNDITLGNFDGLDIIYCDLGNITPTIRVTNTGGNTVTSFDVSVSYNGQAQDGVSWSGNLNSFQNIDLSLGTFTLLEGDNGIEVEVVSVNGTSDSNAPGNFKSLEFAASDTPEFVTFQLNFDDYPQETKWAVLDQNEAVVYQGEDYTLATPNITEELCLPAGCYTFLIEDSAGDGICCGFGIGDYAIIDENGTILIEGGEFGSSEEQEFCVGSLSVNEHPALKDVTAFPNPTKDMLYIDLGQIGENVKTVRMMDATGRMVWTKSGSSIMGNLISHNVSSLSAGVYIIQIDTEMGMLTRKVILSK